MIAILALFLAVGGSAVAAQRYLITSTRQIKPSVLRSLHGAKGATGPQGPSGPAGGAGLTGAEGPRGEAGPSNLSSLTITRAADVKVPPGAEGTSVATCPSGTRVVSGGEYTGFAIRNGSEMSADHQSWIVLVDNLSGVPTNLEAIAYCAGAGEAIAASTSTATHARAVRQVQALAARLRSEHQSQQPVQAQQPAQTQPQPAQG